MCRGITAFFLLVFTFSPSMAQDSTRTFKLEKIFIEGNKSTKAYVILRELPFREGDTITAEEIEYGRERLYSTELFSRVMVQPEPIGRGKIDLLIYVEERWYIWPYPVLGFRDRDWKRFYAGAGIADLNFRGMNEKLGGMFALGHDPFGAVFYSSPSIGRNKDYILSMGASYSKGRNLGVQTGSASGEIDDEFGDVRVSLGKRFGIYSTLTLGASYNYVSARGDTTGLVLSPNGTDIFASLKLSYVYDSRDLKAFASRGTYFYVALGKYGIGESLVNFGRLSFDAREYVPISDMMTLAARTYGDFAEGLQIPIYDNVFIGYYERIRGMFNTISQGESIAGANLELRIPIIKRMYIELPDLPLKQFISNRIGLYWNFFADAGETTDKHLHFGFRDALYGYGTGLSLLLPYDIILQADIARGSDGHVEFILDFGETI